MRSWGVASILVFALVGHRAVAEPIDVSATTATGDTSIDTQSLGYGALPGGLRAASAETLPAGTFGFGAIGGYGTRRALLSPDHKLDSGIGDLALSYAPINAITLALSFDGRIDRHQGRLPKVDMAYVGGPHLLARIATSFGRIRIGGQLGVYLPGQEAPSIVPEATTVDVRGLLSIKAGASTVSVGVGFRYDNTAKSAKSAAVPDPMMFRADIAAEDRVSLGISDFDAVIAGLHVVVPIGRVFVGLETSADVFVGSGALGPILRAGGNVGIHLGAGWSAYAFAQAAHVPSIDYNDVDAATAKLIPYEPTVTTGVGVTGVLGGRAKSTRHIAEPVLGAKSAQPDKIKPLESTTQAVVVGSVPRAVRACSASAKCMAIP